MILELPLPTARPNNWSKPAERTEDMRELRRFICDSVSFYDFAASAKPLRSGDIRFQFDFTLAVEEGVDKLVTVRFDLLYGEELVAATLKPNISAEEGKRTPQTAYMTVRRDKLKHENDPTLRLTVRVQPNP